MLLAQSVKFAAWLVAALANVQEPARQALELCRLSGLDPASLVTRCVTIQVRENRAVTNGRLLSLRVAVVAPDSGGAELPDPIVLLPGGPGGGIINAAEVWARVLRPVRAHRALVLVDPRGAGQSGALDCDFTDGPSRPGSYVRDFAPPAKVRACAADLSRRADLTQYHTGPIIEDLAEVLTALGYRRVNLYGVSGGTRLAFAFAQRYPNRVRTLTLGGVVPPGFRMPLPYAKDFDRALELLFTDCANDAACRAAFPDLRADLTRVLARLERQPALVPLSMPGPKPDTARVTRAVFAERIRRLLYSQPQAATVPYVIHRAAAGDFQPFVEPLVPWAGGEPPPDGVAMGHFLSVTCSEDVDRIAESERAAAASGTILGDYRVQQQVDACKLWPHARLPDSHFTARPLDIPALLISGDADPVTPPRWADSMKRWLPAARHVVFPTGAHVPVASACAAALASRFILAGAARELDVSCAATFRRPPFRLR